MKKSMANSLDTLLVELAGVEPASHPHSLECNTTIIGSFDSHR